LPALLNFLIVTFELDLHISHISSPFLAQKKAKSAGSGYGFQTQNVSKKCRSLSGSIHHPTSYEVSDRMRSLKMVWFHVVS